VIQGEAWGVFYMRFLRYTQTSIEDLARPT